MKKAMKILSGAILCCMSPALSCAQGYVVKWSDPNTYSLSCGSLSGNKWTISNDSCVFLSANINSGGVSGGPDKRANFSLTISPTGNLTDNDFLYVFVYNNNHLKSTLGVRGDTVNSNFTLQVELMVPPNSNSLIQVAAQTDMPQEKWRIEDEGISVVFPTPLPVELAVFSGEMNDNSRVDLSWITHSEVNNDFFTIERSIDGQNFHEVARIKGNGTTTVQSKYRYTESVHVDNLVYYRLKQTDFNGDFKYLGKTITFRAKQVRDLFSLFPNPSRNEPIHVLISDCRHSEISVELRNTNGQVVYAQTVVPSDAIMNLVIDPVTQSLHQGLYLVTVKTPDRVTSERLVIAN